MAQTQVQVASYDQASATRLMQARRRAQANLVRAREAFDNAERLYRESSTEERWGRRMRALGRLRFNAERYEQLTS